MSVTSARDTLATYFVGVAAKTLKPVEVDPKTSNQHELNGINRFRVFMGAEAWTDIPTKLLFLPDDEHSATVVDSRATWYDARAGNNNRSAEYRLYYPANAVMESAAPGDLAIVARRTDDLLLIVVAPNGSTSANQLMWLFGLTGVGEASGTRSFMAGGLPQLGVAAHTLLDELGIEVATAPGVERLVDQLIAEHGEQFPRTRVMSQFAQQTCPVPFDAVRDPDHALMALLSHEEEIFRALERRIVQSQLDRGFGSVDQFISFSLSVQNRRKSRVGHALENHLERIVAEWGVTYERGAQTENRARPDFLYPSGKAYHDDTYPAHRLTMLGVKSSCKDRWRQVLSEARRIEQKHLLTIEPGITETQTAEMAANQLTLVVPEELHDTYSEDQRKQLMTLHAFLEMARAREMM